MTSAPLESLPGLLRSEPGLTRALGEPDARLAVVEVARPIAIAALANLSNRQPLVVACPTGTMAAQLADDLMQFVPEDDVALFPGWETLPFERVSPSVETMGQRLKVLWRLGNKDRSPKIIVAGTEAKIVRKWIKDLPPRALLCLLPNKVIVAYNTVDGSILNAWHSAEINQTPSLPDRSQKPSEIKGAEIPESTRPILKSPSSRFIAYEAKGAAALIHSIVDGKPMTITIAPKGEAAFSISTK